MTNEFDFIMKVNFCRFCVDIYADLGGGFVDDGFGLIYVVSVRFMLIFEVLVVVSNSG